MSLGRTSRWRSPSNADPNIPPSVWERAAATESLERVLAWDCERILTGRGETAGAGGAC